MQEYLTSEELYLEDKRLLFKLRSHSLLNFKCNVKSIFLSDLSCRLCAQPNSEESETHLADFCEVVKSRVDKKLHSVKYEDIFGTLQEQIRATKFWKQVILMFEEKNLNQEL